MSSQFRVHIDTQRFERTLNEFADQTVTTAGEVLYQVAQTILTVSQSDYVPVVTGNLRASGFVDRPVRHGADEISVEMGYSTSYAWARHEAPMDWGQAGHSKYLERAIVDVLSDVDRYFTEGFRRFM